MTTGRTLVVVSSGFGKLHVTLAARETSRRGTLQVAVTGAYPTRRISRLARLTRIADKGRVARLMERGEGIPEDRLRAAPLVEILFDAVGHVATRPGVRALYPRIHLGLLQLYGLRAARHLRRDGAGATVFHYGAGFGHRSVDQAKDMGMVALCDHAIVHPLLLESFIEHRGVLPRAADGTLVPPPELTDPHSLAILADLDRADAVIVNSEFVKQTFVDVGWAPERVHVAYLGVDDNFLDGTPSPVKTPHTGALRLLFAGRFERRKGIDVLVEALAGLDDVDWELAVAGPVARDVHEAHAAFLADPRVKLLGTLLRPRLHTAMRQTDVFVFPSFAEGSARVVFEALACALYVITTPNSGTIVQDGVHGALVQPGEVGALADAIRFASSDRERIAAIGERNAQEVLARYRQKDYGDTLAAIYGHLDPSPRSPATVVER